MPSTLTRKIIVLLISCLVSLVGLELALRIIDPWGMYYIDDVATIWDNVITHHNRIDVLPPGTYQFSTWSVTQIDGYTRYVPDNANGHCQVVFVGDSVTWGHGVNDNDTWVNHLAAALPEATIINAAFEGYNSENVRGTLKDFPNANLIVYLIIENDAETTTGVIRQTRTSMIKRYLTYLFQYRFKPASSQQADASLDMNRFYDDIASIGKDKRVLFLGFDGALTRNAQSIVDVQIIPMYKHSISLVDPHPDKAGHTEIAAQVLPLVRNAIRQKCP